MNEVFEIILKTNFKKKLEEVTASNFSEIIKEEANELCGKTKEEPFVLSTEDQGIKQLEDTMKELRMKEDKSE